MNDIDRLKKELKEELEEINRRFEKIKEENTVKNDDWPKFMQKI